MTKPHWVTIQKYIRHSKFDIPARRNLWSSSQVQLLVPRYRKEPYGRGGFSVSSPQLCNLFPANIRLLHNEHQLSRKRLKTHYMQQSMLRHWGSMSTVWSLLCQQCDLYYYYYYYYYYANIFGWLRKSRSTTTIQEVLGGTDWLLTHFYNFLNFWVTNSWTLMSAMDFLSRESS